MCGDGEDGMYYMGLEEGQEIRDRLEAQVAILRKALEWYADEMTWTVRGHPQIDYDTKPILRDNGRRAREALGMLQ